MVGFVFLFLSNIALGIFADVPEKYPSHFVLVNGIARFAQGYGDSLSMASCMSLISHNFQDSQEKYIGLVGSALGVGLMIGPPLGSCIYSGYNYPMVFYFFSTLIFVILIM